MRKILLLIMVMAVSFTGLKAQKDKKKEKKREYIECLYFHRTNVCPSCVEIKKCIQEVLEEVYSREIKKGKIVYHRVDYEKNPKNKHVLDYAIDKPTLFLIYHNKGKSSVIDLTTEGFKYALHQPDKFKKIVVDSINECFR